MDIDELLATIPIVVDDRPHIQVDSRICRDCPHHNCTFCCPARCFEEEGPEVRFLYHGCMECGACRIVCDRGAVAWGYPRGGYGVAFCFG